MGLRGSSLGSRNTSPSADRLGEEGRPDLGPRGEATRRFPVGSRTSARRRGEGGRLDEVRTRRTEDDPPSVARPGGRT